MMLPLMLLSLISAAIIGDDADFQRCCPAPCRHAYADAAATPYAGERSSVREYAA